MTNRILIFFALLVCLPFVVAQPQPPPADPTRLAYSIENAPPEIEAKAESLGIERIAYVKPALYTRGNADRTVRTFNREKAEQRLAEIAAICDGATWIITDIEKKHRDAVRHPDRFSGAEVKEAVDQYIACWSWFRSHWPDAMIFEWNLSNAREAGRNTFAEKLILKHLDGFAVSVFYRHKRNWQEVRGQVVAHANSLVASNDKIVIAGIHEKYNAHQPDGTSKSTPVPSEIVDAMVEVALEADVTFLWSVTYARIAVDPLAVTNARIELVLTKMRSKAAEQTP